MRRPSGEEQRTPAGLEWLESAERGGWLGARAVVGEAGGLPPVGRDLCGFTAPSVPGRGT